MPKQELTRVFNKILIQSKEYQEAITLLEKNHVGKTWIIGGFIYRNLASCLYGTRPVTSDMDFIVEQIPTKPSLPDSWNHTVNHFGNPKYSRDGLSLDVVPLTNIHSIRTNKLAPTIENYLLGVPLTIQSIAYDIETKEIIGDVGITSLLQKVVSVNNSEELHYLAQKYKRSMNSYISEKASSLCFTSKLISSEPHTYL
ncbi:MAG TPA: hypothetical protein VGE59_04115 [Patescibacteria group bacterium]